MPSLYVDSGYDLGENYAQTGVWIDWLARVIYVPKTESTLVQSSPVEIRELDLNAFRLSLLDLQDNEEGMAWLDTHSHNLEVSVGGVTLARVIQIINEYTVTFEDGTYVLNLVGANSNVIDRINHNNVSVRSANSAGLQVVSSGGGASAEDIATAVWAHSTAVSQGARLLLIEKLLRNKFITDPVTGQAVLYDNDGTTVLLAGPLYENVGATQPYRGQGADRRDRLV